MKSIKVRSGVEYIGEGKKMDRAFNRLCQAMRSGVDKEISLATRALAQETMSPAQRKQRERSRQRGDRTIPERRAAHLLCK